MSRIPRIAAQVRYLALGMVALVLPLIGLLAHEHEGMASETAARIAEPTTKWVRACFQEGLEKSNAKRRRRKYGNVVLWSEDSNQSYVDRSRNALVTLQWIRLDPQDLSVRDGILEITVRPLRALSMEEQREVLGELMRLIRASLALRGLPGGASMTDREIEAFVARANVEFTAPLQQFRMEEVTDVQVAEALGVYLRQVEQNDSWRREGIDLLEELKLFNSSGLGFDKGYGGFASRSSDKRIEVSWEWRIEVQDVNRFRESLPTITQGIRSDVVRARRDGPSQRLFRFQQSIVEANEAYQERFRDSFDLLLENALTRFPQAASGLPLLEVGEAEKGRIVPQGPSLPRDYRDVMEAGATAAGIGQGGSEMPNSIRLGGMQLVKTEYTARRMTELGGWTEGELSSSDPASSSEALIRFDDGGFGGGQISALDFSGDGRFLAVLGDVVRVWEMADGGQADLIIPYPADRPDPPRDLAISPDAQQVVLAMSEGLQVFDRAQPERPRQRMMMSSGGIRRVCFSPSGRYLATAGDDGIVTIWDWPARYRMKAYEFQQPVESLVFADEFQVAAFVQQSASAVGIATISVNSTESGPPDEVTLVDDILRAFKAGQMPQGGRVHPYAISVKANYPAPLIACGGTTELAGNRFQYWSSLHRGEEKEGASFSERRDGQVGSVTRSEAPQNYGVSATAISPDGRYAAVADSSGDVLVRDCETFKTLRQFRGRRWVFSVGFGESPYVWRMGRTPNRGTAWQRNQYGALEQEFDFVNRRLRRIPTAPSPAAVLSQGEDSVAYDLASGKLSVSRGQKPVASISLKDSRATDVLWHSLIPHRLDDSQGSGVIVGNEAGELILFDRDTLRPKRTFVGHGDRVWGAAAEGSESSSAGRFLLSGSGDGIVRLWSLEDYRPRYSIGALVDGSEVVQHSYPESGLEIGDRVLRVGGVSLSNWLEDSRSLMVPQGPVKVEIVRRGQPRTLDISLIEVGDLAEPLLQGYFAYDSSEWVVWSRSGFYDASPNSHHLLRWIMPHRDVPGGLTMVAEQVRDRYHRPDVIDLILELGNEQAAIRQAFETKPPRFVDETTPQPVVEIGAMPGAAVVAPRPQPLVELREPPARTLKQTREPSQRVVARVICQTDSLPRITVLVNNTIVPITATPVEDAEAAGQFVYEIDTQVDLEDGINELVVIATVDGLSSSRTSAKTTIERLVDAEERTKPTLYVLACGNNDYLPESGLDPLRFAAADAIAISEAFPKRFAASGSTFSPYRDVVVKVLTNEQANLAGIKQAFDEIVNASQKGDRIMLFFAMHGILDGDRREDLWLVPHGGNPAAKSSSCLSWRELVGLAVENNSRDWVLFLDVCHSIALGGQDAAADRMLRADFSGIVYSACGPRETDNALENSGWGHGAFTIALLEALNDQAIVEPSWGELRPDPNGDRIIDTDDLQGFLKNRVQQLTDGKQTPHYMRPGTLDFALF